MHAVSTNQIADILHFNDNYIYDILSAQYPKRNQKTAAMIQAV